LTIFTPCFIFIGLPKWKKFLQPTTKIRFERDRDEGESLKNSSSSPISPPSWRAPLFPSNRDIMEADSEEEEEEENGPNVQLV